MSPADGSTRITTTYGINITACHMVAQFSAPVQNLVMKPAEATAMAVILLNCAKELDPASVAGFTWPGMDIPMTKTPIPDAQPQGKPS